MFWDTKGVFMNDTVRFHVACSTQDLITVWLGTSKLQFIYNWHRVTTTSESLVGQHYVDVQELLFYENLVI